MWNNRNDRENETTRNGFPIIKSVVAIELKATTENFIF